MATTTTYLGLTKPDTTEHYDIGVHNTNSDLIDTAVNSKVDKVAGKSLISDTEITRLLCIETGAEVNNISDVNATDLTDGGDTNLHTHDSRYYTETETNSLLGNKADKLFATNLVTNGDFSNGTTGFTKPGGLNWAVNSGKLRVDRVSGSIYITSVFNFINTNKYYVKIGSLTTDMSDLFVYLNSFARIDNQPNRSVVLQATANGNGMALGRTVYTDGTYFEIDNILVIDLTAIFGAGKEPSKEQMDNLLSTFPNSWFNGTAELVNIANLAQLKADKTQEAWQSLTLTNSWVTNELQLRFMKDQFGFVHIEGNIKSGTIGANVATLPAGYRPLLTKRFPVATATGYGRINIANTGAISINEGSNTWVAIDGVVFKAEA